MLPSGRGWWQYLGWLMGFRPREEGQLFWGRKEREMMRWSRSAGFLAALMMCLPPSASAGITELKRCQTKFARAGARFANQSIKSALKCSNEISQCLIQCDQGVFVVVTGAVFATCDVVQRDPLPSHDGSEHERCAEGLVLMIDTLACVTAGSRTEACENIVHD